MHVVVIGSGLLGISTAYYLRQHGLEVTVLDRADGPGLETSFANGAMLTPSLADPWNAPGVFWTLVRWLGREDSPMLVRAHALPSLLSWGTSFLSNAKRRRFEDNTRRNIRLAEYSLEVMGRLRDATSIQYQRVLSGTLKVCRSAKSLEKSVAMARLAASCGIKYQVLDRDGVVGREPALAAVAADFAGGVFLIGDECGDAYLYCRAMHRLAEDQGVAFRFNSAATRFIRSGGRLTAVITDGGTVGADVFVIAAGSYSPTLVRPLGIRLLVTPVKGYSITARTGRWPNRPRVPLLDDQLHAAIVPIGDRIRVAGTAEFAGYDLTVSRSRIMNLRSMLRRIYPDFERTLQENDIEAWAGLRPMSASGVPILGRTGLENLYLNTGHGHLGWSMAAGSGKAVADLIAGKEPEIMIADYGLGSPRR